jgi:Reverse transcriptase (RNA-dependent DNA polymerase)/RNase H-like domain found in reverse transcriptase
MATLIKVNGLEAYALLDLGSTTVSITHDFGCVAKLNIMQLENPIALQLGTVGSWSIINVGLRSLLELGPIKDDNVYLDVVNIDRYNMIIGTLFMWKHRLMLDFHQDKLYRQGQIILTMSAGQEDLMVARKRSTQAQNPATAGAMNLQYDHWLPPWSASPSQAHRRLGTPLLLPSEGRKEHCVQLMDTTNETNVKEIDLQSLCNCWFVKYATIMNGSPQGLPPMREINHRIPLIDHDKQYSYWLLHCPEAMHPKLMAKLCQYIDNGWWTPKAVSQAAPLLCILKKSGSLQTVMDCRQCSDNTYKDVTPFPDQDQIWMDVAHTKYRSKIDLSNAYEQVWVAPEDVHKTTFSTVFGTFESNVMQQGDCNAPTTFLHLMMAIFCKVIGIFIYAYLDDLFIFSNTLPEHERHLDYVFYTLKKHHLYLEKDKCDLYSTSIDCLGHWIDDQGVHADSDKMVCIREWCTPCNHKDVQCFLGLVQYLAHFMPDITAYTSPISAICQNGQLFYWKPLYEMCFQNIKAIACKSLILKPINPTCIDPIWVICDALTLGIRAMYGQGENWQTCCPAGFMSKKFTLAQMNYCVFEMETIAILEALLKWEDKLLGCKLKIVTDHKALEFFKTQCRLNSRQAR